MFLVVFILIFLAVIGIFVYIIVRNVGQWNKNNHSPRLTVNARIVGKRMDITNRHRTRMGGTRNNRAYNSGKRPSPHTYGRYNVYAQLNMVLCDIPV